MFDELMLPDEAVLQRLGPDTTRTLLQIRLPWYRSLPVSCIEGIDIAIDDEAVSPENLSIGIGGEHYPLSEAAQLHDAWWFVLDTLQAEIQTPAPVSPGDHRVRLSLSLRIPYASPDRIGARFPRFMQTAVGTRTVSFIGKDV